MTTAKKKDDLAGPYELEIANNYMRNAFKMEVIMSLKEQRKQRPAKYKIKNVKKAKRNALKHKVGNLQNEDHHHVVLLFN